NGDSDDVERGFRRMLNDLAGMSEMLFKMPDKRSEDRGGAVRGDSNQGLSGSLPFPRGARSASRTDCHATYSGSSTPQARVRSVLRADRPGAAPIQGDSQQLPDSGRGGGDHARAGPGA